MACGVTNRGWDTNLNNWMEAGPCYPTAKGFNQSKTDFRKGYKQDRIDTTIIQSIPRPEALVIGFQHVVYYWQFTYVMLLLFRRKNSRYSIKRLSFYSTR